MGLFDWLRLKMCNPRSANLRREGARSPASDLEASTAQGSTEGEGISEAGHTLTVQEHREKTIQRLRESPEADGWRWSAAHDAHTCPWCLLRDGQVYSLDTPFVPCHKGCRCTVLPVEKSAAERFGYPMLPERPPQRSSGEEWFNQQEEAIQRRILGGAAFTRWRASGLGFRPYVERHGWKPTQAHLDDWDALAKRRQNIKVL